MSVKGYYRYSALGWVHLRQFYTGLRFKVPEGKAYTAKSPDGLLVIAALEDAVME